MRKIHRWAFQLGKLGALGTGLYGGDRKEFVLLRENCQCDLFVKPNPLPRNIGNNVCSYKLPRDLPHFLLPTHILLFIENTYLSIK